MSSGAESSALSSIASDLGISSFNQAAIPANVRDGNAQAQDAYVEGLAFEQVLVNQLTTQMANNMGSGGLDASTDGSDGSADSSGGLLGGSSDSAYSSLIPQALTSSIMSGGGLGMADEIAQAIDPSLNDPGTESGS